MKTKFTKCYCCGYETMCKSIDTSDLFGRGITSWYCNICSNTMAGRISEHYGAYHNIDVDTMKMIAYVGNVITDKLDKILEE